jgi:hypothetical protein
VRLVRRFGDSHSRRFCTGHEKCYSSHISASLTALGELAPEAVFSYYYLHVLLLGPVSCDCADLYLSVGETHLRLQYVPPSYSAHETVS